ncbi:hypothetical protein [Janibacter cremeus]|uniref:Uncharacterized protein n=1 Tax=Janibacter cremeus TaxID=1285192 RepID=A0A852VXM9_9MICO|nr:hypothetical protein [Janibacter cremeus]NYF98525.1 hypothetical protein [Janibacter cremeus]
MRTTARTLSDIALRSMALIGFYLGASWIVGLLPGSGGANIGAGLLLFVVIMVLSGLGGLYDGRRAGFLRTVVIWAATSVIVAMGMVALIDGFHPFDADIFWSDLRDIGALMVGLVVMPALLGGLITGLTRADREYRSCPDR